MTTTSFLKWAGGKSWLTSRYPHLIPYPARGCAYREPFLGGGSVFFGAHTATRPAVLSDVNRRLIDTYRAVRDHVEELILELSYHPYDRAHYLDVRHRLNTEPHAPLVDRAAWFLVVNKYGFNGLYRENHKGEVNVPFGKTSSGAAPLLCDAEQLRACSKALHGVTLLNAAYDTQLNRATEGDAVFLDPPYVPASKTSNFTGYAAGGFSDADQGILASWLRTLDSDGVRWVLTNSDTPETRKLYAKWPIIGVSARRSINCNASKRGAVGEIVVLGRACREMAEAA